MSRINVIPRESKAISILFDFLETRGVNFKRFDENDLELVKLLLNEKQCILWINNHATLKPVYVNNYGKEYYGFESNNLNETGFELYGKFLDPDHFEDVHKTIAFFSNNPTSIHRMTYRVRNHEGHWKWTYSLAKALNYDAVGRPQYILAVVFDVESMVDGVIDKKLNNLKNTAAEAMRQGFGKLTRREVEVLHLIAQEYTSLEIAEQLYIEASTVDTHRKNMIRKLGVKSSLGLVQYSLSFK